MVIKNENKNVTISGFTIVELLIVIVVIAILAALIASSYVGMNRKATIASLQSDLKNSSIKLAIDKTNNDSYPATKEAADNGKGLKASPNNTYEYTSNGSTYCLSETSGTLAYFLSSENGVPTPGVCPGHLLPVGYDDGGAGGGGGEEPITSGWKRIISYAVSRTCGIAYNDHAYCWGYDSGHGDLGTGVVDDSKLIPTAILQGEMPSLAIKDISMANTHTCAIGSDNHPYCWGGNYDGQLGDGTSAHYNDQLSPKAVLQGAMPDLNVKAIYAGPSRTCAINFNSRLYCWGANSVSQLGDGTTTNRNVPVAVLQGEMPNLEIKAASLANRKTCVIASNDNVYCWGYYPSSPIAILQGEMPSLKVKSISSGLYHVCAIALDNNQAYCWGRNDRGQLGNGTTVDPGVEVERPAPQAILQGNMPTPNVKSISATGGDHTCAISSDDHGYCWGGNSYGQIGMGGIGGNYLLPTAVVQGDMPGLSIKNIAISYNHTCAIANNNQSFCWGVGGRLGNNNTDWLFAPSAVVDPF